MEQKEKSFYLKLFYSYFSLCIVWEACFAGKQAGTPSIMPMSTCQEIPYSPAEKLGREKYHFIRGQSWNVRPTPWSLGMGDFRLRKAMSSADQCPTIHLRQKKTLSSSLL